MGWRTGSASPAVPNNKAPSQNHGKCPDSSNIRYQFKFVALSFSNCTKNLDCSSSRFTSANWKAQSGNPMTGLQLQAQRVLKSCLNFLPETWHKTCGMWGLIVLLSQNAKWKEMPLDCLPIAKRVRSLTRLFSKDLNVAASTVVVR